VTDIGPSQSQGPSHVLTVAPTPPRPSRRWLPWAAIVIVVAVALGVALPLTLGSSSSTATPTPKSPTTSPGASGITGSYYSPTIQDSSLFLLRLVQDQSTLTGDLTVTTAAASHLRLVDHRYAVTGSLAGSKLKLTIAPLSTRPQPVAGSYVLGVITIILASGTKVSLKRGTLAIYRALVVADRSLLLK
jgi:hypothetical protein